MYIYRGEDIKRVDQSAEENGLNTFTLMENAGRSLFIEIEKQLKKSDRILILSGTGNNGGDGIVLARYLKEANYHCDLVFPLGMSATETAQAHLHYFENCGYSTSVIDGDYDVIIDALLGVGTRLPLPPEITKLIDWANKQSGLKIAIDVPTGVLANKGIVDDAFRADYTYSLHGLKPSAFTEGSFEFYGEKKSLPIGVAHDSKWRVWSKEDVKSTFLKRHGGANKGTFGTGLLVAGDDEMPGSALLASLGAMRAGIGKLTVATSHFTSSIIAARVPECTYLHNGLKKLAKGKRPKAITAVAIGPGLADAELVEQAVNTLFASKLPLVLDAGALTARDYPKRQAPTIVTPHPGEFSRMTGLSVTEIQHNRLELASEYARTNDVIVVLKGRNTVIAFPDGTLFVNPTGNVGLAKGGTGDTLTGIMLAHLSCYSDVKAAVLNAVYLHGATADYWCETKAATSMTASDISENLAIVMKKFE